MEGVFYSKSLIIFLYGLLASLSLWVGSVLGYSR